MMQSYRYSSEELHTLARALSTELDPDRQRLGRHLRRVADALSEIAKHDEGRTTAEEEQDRIERVFSSAIFEVVAP